MKRQQIGTPEGLISLGKAFEIQMNNYCHFAKLTQDIFEYEQDGNTTVKRLDKEYSNRYDETTSMLEKHMREAFSENEYGWFKLNAYYKDPKTKELLELDSGDAWLCKSIPSGLDDYCDNFQPPIQWFDGQYVKIFLKDEEFSEWQLRDLKRFRYHSVQYCKLTPDEEIEIANALPFKVEPLIQNPEISAFDPLEEQHWNIAMLLAWVIWQDMEQVTQFWDKYRKEFQFWGAALKTNMPDGNGNFKTEYFRDAKRKYDTEKLYDLYSTYTQFNEAPIVTCYDDAKSLINKMRATGRLTVYKKEFEQLEVYQKDNIFIDSPRWNLVVKLEDIISPFHIPTEPKEINTSVHEIDILIENGYWIYASFASNYPIKINEFIFLYDAFHDYYMSQKPNELDDFCIASQFTPHLFRMIFIESNEFKESGLTKQQYIADLYDNNKLYRDILFRILMFFIFAYNTSRHENRFKYIDKKRTGELLELVNKNQITGNHIAEIILNNQNVNEYLSNMEQFFIRQKNQFLEILRFYDVQTGLRPIIGGAIERIETGFWITEQMKPLYKFCAFNQSAPYCENPFKAEGEVKWIYLDRASLQQAIEKSKMSNPQNASVAPVSMLDKLTATTKHRHQNLVRGRKPTNDDDFLQQMKSHTDSGVAPYTAANIVIGDARAKIEALFKQDRYSTDAIEIGRKLGSQINESVAKRLVSKWRLLNLII